MVTGSLPGLCRPATRILCVAILVAAWSVAQAWAGSVLLQEMDPGTTSPGGVSRWRDAADYLYAEDYRSTYEYGDSNVVVDYDSIGPVLTGTLTASDLKPNFSYQLKLVGYSDDPSNEQIGLTGRWWQEYWDGSKWTGGTNLNNKGDGSSPNPNDLVYFDRRDIADPTSPTGLHYRYTGYLVLDYFTTDQDGATTLSFEADSSYHVLWKTSQLSPGIDDGPLKSATFDPDPALHPAYDVDHPEATVGVFGEWERLPVGGVHLPDGPYLCQVMLTEESFHGSGGDYSGGWAAAVGGEIAFDIQTSFVLALSAGWNLVSIPLEPLDPARETVFPSASVAAVWGYNNPGGYETPDEIHPGRGYWVKAPAVVDLTVTGQRPVSKAVALAVGWNLVGVMGKSRADPRQPVPEVIAIWQYGNPGGYAVPTVCEDGRGFWIKVDEDTAIWDGP